jgi:RNA polymerase sigma-70 factor (ECF subfamily)
VGVDLLAGNRRLLEGFRAGEDAALREVLRHYGPVVARSVRRGVRIIKGKETMSFRGPSEEMDVERVVQETFSRAFSDGARQRYDGITPYAAYLCRVARNLMISEAQVAKRTPQPTDSGDLPELDSLTPSPEEQVQHTELAGLVARFLSERPDEEKQLYEARFRHGETQEGAAQRLGLHRITVRRTEARLKTAFVRFLLRHKVISPADARAVVGGGHDA